MTRDWNVWSINSRPMFSLTGAEALPSTRNSPPRRVTWPPIRLPLTLTAAELSSRSRALSSTVTMRAEAAAPAAPARLRVPPRTSSVPQNEVSAVNVSVPARP